MTRLTKRIAYYPESYPELPPGQVDTPICDECAAKVAKTYKWAPGRAIVVYGVEELTGVCGSCE